MRKLLIPLGITCAVLVVIVVVCAIGASLGVFGLARSLPTAAPTPALLVNRSYWIGALLPPPGLPAGLVLRYATIYNKPANSLTDPSVTVIALVPDATKVALIGVQGKWCYVRGTYNFMAGIDIPTAQAPIPTPDFTRLFEGWIECNRLLDYAPTPFPTPNKTPQPP